MRQYIFKRLLEAIPTLFIIATLTFFMVRLAPGDPFSSEKEASAEVRNALRAHFDMVHPDKAWHGMEVAPQGDGLVITDVAPNSPAQSANIKPGTLIQSLKNAPVTRQSWQEAVTYHKPGDPWEMTTDAGPVTLTLQPQPTSLLHQYGNFLKKLVFEQDLGPSFKYPGWTVSELIRSKLSTSLELGLLALSIAIVIGIGAGVLAASRPNTMRDYIPMSVSMMGICLPTFVLGPIIVLIFALNLNWFNASGWYSWQDRVLPALTLGCAYAAYIARLTRGSMLEVRNQDYIRTARAKGVSEARILLVHGLRNGILPVVSFLGPAVAGLISGSFIIETIFNIPGLGKFFVTSATNRDYTMVMGTVLLFSTLLVLLNLLTDLILAWLNPKMKLE